jgi:hypothetical protein
MKKKIINRKIKIILVILMMICTAFVVISAARELEVQKDGDPDDPIIDVPEVCRPLHGKEGDPTDTGLISEIYFRQSDTFTVDLGDHPGEGDPDDVG